ncbi:MAG: sigma 54-interacting transcriptional regulator, partial [Myxococcota bacterium]|nr:sigma 54-interacting transcriptional regulator [Myxococcota bacterium]
MSERQPAAASSGRIRSLLFVGRAEALRAEAVADAPRLDVAWVRDVDEALALPLPAFDAIVIDAPDLRGGCAALAHLTEAGDGLPPLLVRLPDAPAADHETLRAAGAAAVLAGRAQSGAAGHARLLAVLDRVVRPWRRRPPGFPDEPPKTARLGDMIARGPRMLELFALLEQAMPSTATVLLTGETGTGKELLARALHAGSPRRNGPFVAANCAAFPDTLLESELFGHARGAFTGADRARDGLFEAASGGTLFLDEIGETSPSLQAKLLRALQEREVRPLGGNRSRRVDVRVVAATNRALRDEVAAGRFREDLFYRLAVFHIGVPPLRARPEDVVPLAEHFLRRHGAREDRPGCRLSRGAADLLRLHPWPGNVRELENEMQRALAVAEPGEAIAPRHLSERVHGTLDPLQEVAGADGETLRDQLQRLEAFLLRRSLDAHAGRRAATA